MKRVKNIENKQKTKQIELREEIKVIESEIYELPKIKLSHILKSSDFNFSELIDLKGLPNRDLLAYLVKNGCLDENYHMYISSFHEGRLTKNDRDYILATNNFNQSIPNQRIDTPKEVCEIIGEDGFGHEYVLNVNLIDYLLENNEICATRIALVMDYISRNFDQTEDFFTSYFIHGKNIDKLVCYLSQAWPDFASAAIYSRNGTEQISYILKFVESEYIVNHMNKDNLLSDYLSEQGHLVLASNLPLPDNYRVIKEMNVNFHDLTSLDINNILTEFSYTEGLYTINAKNVNYILQKLHDENNTNPMNPEMANYTSILTAGSESLKEYIDDNLPTYLEKVFLILPDNSAESEVAIKALINHEMVDDDLMKKIISKQDYVFETFEEVPTSLWSYLLLNEKIIISWHNISNYLNYDDGDREILTDILQCPNTVNILSKLNIRSAGLDSSDCESLSWFILSNNDIKDPEYCKLIRSIPIVYTAFPDEISKEKIDILAKEIRVVLSDKSFSYAGSNSQLISMLIINSFNEYLKRKDNYPINNDVRELLLESEINDANKNTILLDVTPSGITENKTLSRLIARLLISIEIDCSEFDNAVLASAIVNAQETRDSIKLLIKCIPTWTEEQTMDVITDLPEPFNEISSYGNRTKINNNKLNLELSKLLKEKDFIATFEEKGKFIIINTFESSDHSVLNESE